LPGREWGAIAFAPDDRPDFLYCLLGGGCDCCSCPRARQRLLPNLLPNLILIVCLHRLLLWVNDDDHDGTQHCHTGLAESIDYRLSGCLGYSMGCIDSGRLPRLARMLRMTRFLRCYRDRVCECVQSHRCRQRRVYEVEVQGQLRDLRYDSLPYADKERLNDRVIHHRVTERRHFHVYANTYSDSTHG
jgi:hypothetical protein